MSSHMNYYKDYKKLSTFIRQLINKLTQKIRRMNGFDKEIAL